MSFVDLAIPFFINPSNGKPVYSGSIYIGEPDTDPEIATNQKTVRLRQENGVEVVTAQPIETSTGGIPLYNGSPVQIIVDGNYSLKVLDHLGAQVYYIPSGANLTALGSLVPQIDIQTATEGQTFFTLKAGMTYTVGGNDIAIYIDGRRQYPSAYTESSETTITFTEGLAAGQEVMFVSNEIEASLSELQGSIEPETGKAVLWDGLPIRDIRLYGVVFDGVTDNAAAIDSAITAATAAGGMVLWCPPGTAVTEGAHIIDADNVYFLGTSATIFERKTTATSFMFWWARNNDTSGGGILGGITLKGIPSIVSGGNGGVCFGYSDGASTNNNANNWRADVICDSWAQYGIGVYGGNDWTIERAVVKNHGFTAQDPGSCIGAFVFPRVASTGGRIKHLVSEISEASMAFPANSAAVKLQVHSEMKVDYVHAVGGTELVMSIDSTDLSVYDNLLIEGKGSFPGLAIRSRSPVHAFVGKFTINTTKYTGTFSSAFVIAAGTSGDANHVLEGCVVSNQYGVGQTVQANNYASFKDCNFSDWRFATVNLSPTLKHPSLLNTGNKARDILAESGSLTMFTDSSYLEKLTSLNAAASGIVIDGNSNIIRDPISRGAGIYGIWLRSGYDNNLVISPFVEATSTLIRNDGGSGNLVSSWVLPLRDYTLDFDLTALNVNTLTVSYPGANINDIVLLGLPSTLDGNTEYRAYVSGTDIVAIQAARRDYSIATDPVSGNFSVAVMKG